MRLDSYMALYWPEYSRSVWQKYISSGFVSVNGVVNTSSKYLMDEDDHVTVSIPRSPDFSDKSIEIVYEDEHVIVLNKPSGILTHAKGAISDEFTVADFVKPRLVEPDDTNRPGIVHRLDRDTSGVIICAKDGTAKRLLQKQFADRKAHKTYLAVVMGSPKTKSATLELPIERNPKHPSEHRVGVNGKPAVTRYEVIKSNSRYSLMRLRPLTGRTHQLRVHMQYIGTPILGDRIYGTEVKVRHRLMLHAESLEITIPPSLRKTFETNVPIDMQRVIDDIDG